MAINKRNIIEKIKSVSRPSETKMPIKDSKAKIIKSCDNFMG